MRTRTTRTTSNGDTTITTFAKTTRTDTCQASRTANLALRQFACESGADSSSVFELISCSDHKTNVALTPPKRATEGVKFHVGIEVFIIEEVSIERFLFKVEVVVLIIVARGVVVLVERVGDGNSPKTL